MQNWRRAIGTILIAVPLLVLVAIIPVGVLLGSLGMDIHFTSKVAAYFFTCCFIATVCACPLVGLRLRRTGDHKEDAT